MPYDIHLGTDCSGFFDSMTLLRLTPLRMTVVVIVPGADGGAQLFHYFVGGFAGGFLLRNFERNGADPGVSAATVALTNLRQIHHRLRGAQGFDPTETFTRKLLLLRPTL